jgi:hypothetical protein
MVPSDGDLVTPPDERRHRAGGPISDLCRACKAVRDHTVMAVDAAGRAARVVCDFCGSQHNYRGGGGDELQPQRAPSPSLGRPAPATGPRLAAPQHDGPRPSAVSSEPRVPAPVPYRAAHEAASERTPPVSSEPGSDLETLLRRVVREELGLTPGVPAPKWRGGEIVLRPGKAGLQEKSWPVDALFHKIVMIRNRLRTLEQQLNAAEIPEDLKLRLQSYVSGCYGSLTSFNVLFADEADQFKGGGGE